MIAPHGVSRAGIGPKGHELFTEERGMITLQSRPDMHTPMEHHGSRQVTMRQAIRPCPCPTGRAMPPRTTRPDGLARLATVLTRPMSAARCAALAAPSLHSLHHHFRPPLTAAKRSPRGQQFPPAGRPPVAPLNHIGNACFSRSSPPKILIKMLRALYERRSERSDRLPEQLEFKLDKLTASAAEDELATVTAIQRRTTYQPCASGPPGFSR